MTGEIQRNDGVNEILLTIPATVVTPEVERGSRSVRIHPSSARVRFFTPHEVFASFHQVSE